MLEVHLLGTFDVKYKKKSITISSRPAQSLFAYLILRAGISHRREKLAGLLWPDSLEETARSNLRSALWRIRKAFPSHTKDEYLAADDLAITFKISSDYWLDAAELEKLSENASADELIAVLSNYQGELLPGFYDEWVVLEREHLNSVFEKKMARLMSLLQNEHRWPDILDWGERWIKLGQKPEPAYRGLMSAHAAKGDMSKVAATYERCVKSLRKLGIEPSEQTHELFERLKTGKEKFEQQPSLAPTIAIFEAQPATNLPVPLTSFIGREKAVEEILRLLSKNRLVTLTGPGGVGKTRLAIQSSNKLLDQFKDGVWWVELAPLTDETFVPQALAKSLGVRDIPNQSLNETLSNFLRSKQLLLVLDNCEHLIAGCAQLADRLLSTCPTLKILTTSREALGLTGEDIWYVPILSLPDPQRISLTDLLMQYEAIRLFVERAGAVRSDFSLTERNALAVAQVCQRLDGMPLAIELAAARVKMMSVGEIAKRLDDRFDLLTVGSRTALPRHQTLRAAVDWSHELLTEPEQILFRKLAVFAGGFTLEAAEAVTAGGNVLRSQVTDFLGQLINKSLVTVEARSENTEARTRYGMLETIREYAREKLMESGEKHLLCTRHLEFFVTFTEHAQYQLHAAEQKLWYSRLEDDHDNLRAALAWALQDRAIEKGMRIVGALRWFWWIRGYWSEGREWAVQFISQPEGQARTYVRGQAIGAAGDFLYELGDLVAGEAHLRESMSIGRELGDAGKTLVGLGIFNAAYIAWAYQRQDLDEARRELGDGLSAMENAPPHVQWITAGLHAFLAITFNLQGDYIGAREHSEKSMNLSRAIGDRYMLAYPLRELGSSLARQGRLAEAKRHYQEALALERELNNRKNTAVLLRALSAIACLEGDYHEARATLEAGLVLSRELAWQQGIGRMLYSLAFAEQLAGHIVRAGELYKESLPLCIAYGDKIDVVSMLDGIAQLAALRGNFENAAHLFGASAQGGETDNSALWYVMRPEHERWIQLVRESLGGERFAALEQAGHILALEQAIEFALQESKG
jgi:predicted ATPase/DNA-binding SARP family transcriptional activator